MARRILSGQAASQDPQARIRSLEIQLAEARATIQELQAPIGKSAGNAERQVAERQQQGAVAFAAFPNENPNPVVRIAADGVVIYANPAAMHASRWNCTPNHPAPEVLTALVQRAFAEKEILEVEDSIGDRDYWIYIVPFPGAGYANAYGRDITLRKEDEKQLERNRRELRKLNRALKQRNSELETERARWQGVVEGIADEVWVCDTDGRMSLMNLRAVTAMELDEFEQQSLQEVLDEVDIYNADGQLRPLEETPLLRSLKGEVLRGEETMRHRRTGRVRHRRFSSAPTRNAQGEITGAVAIVHDVTDLKEAEQALAESRSRINDILASLADGLLAIDRNWNVIYINPTAAEISQLPESEVRGRNFWDLWPALRGTPVGNLYRRAMEQRIPAKMRVKGLQSDRWYDVNVYPSSEGITIFYVDKTEQVRAEEAQARLTEENRQQGALLEAILQADPGGIAVFRDADLRFQFVNAAYRAMLPVRGVEPVGKTIQEVWPTSMGFHVEETYLRRREGGEPVKFDRVTRKFPDGTVRHFSLHIQPLMWRDEPATLVAVWEITQQEETKARLEEYSLRLRRSNQDLQEFAFVASHDLQEPLRKIESFGELLQQRSTHLDEREREYLERMRGAAARMRAMVEGLLQLSRITTHSGAFERVALSAVAEDVVSDLNYQIERTGGRVDVEPLPDIDGDPAQLRQLLQNLVSNALKYHKPNVPPRVQVTARQVGGDVELRVTDAGIGFDPQQASRLFQPFQRLVGRSEYEGSGLGLAICRRIVERHRGEIRALGTPGEGSTFIVRLPIHQPQAASSRPPKETRHDE